MFTETGTFCTIRWETRYKVIDARCAEQIFESIRTGGIHRVLH